MTREELQDYYIDMAKRRGAANAAAFYTGDIVFDYRTRLKCMFGCDGWGNGHMCPSRPGSFQPWEYESLFNLYTWGILVHAHDKKMSHIISFEIERDAYLKDYYFALSLSDCAVCEECTGFKGEPCRSPEKARPAMQHVGIDVFRTARNFGYPIETLRTVEERENWYSVVYIE